MSDSTCPWCGDPSPPGKLCDACAEADLSVRWCPARAPGDDYGYTGCGVCPILAARERDREEQRASLRVILRNALRECGTRWSGFEFAKVWALNTPLNVLEAAGADRRVELDAALGDLTDAEYGRLRCYVGGLPART